MRILLLLGLFVSAAFGLTYRGSDLSSVAVVEKNGISYTDNGKKLPLETILKNHGSNAARIRIWTAGDYNLNYALALGKRVKAAGMTLIVDLHYSDTCKFFGSTYPRSYLITVKGPTLENRQFLLAGRKISMD